MNPPSPSESNDPPARPSRWKLAQDGADRSAAVAALRELAGSYWYCVYAWWRRAGLDATGAPAATLASFGQWLGDAAPQAADSGSARLREWLAARLAELSASGVQPEDEPRIAIDPAWAEARYADEPEGDAGAIFHRRWALTILEFTTSAVQAEYAARGEDKLFEELLAFAGFEAGGDEHYATAASRTGRTSGAMRKAVFDFRTRHRELLREIVADTVADAGDIESEITALLLACDAAGPQGAAAPLPTILQSVQPDEVLARAMDSVRMSSAGVNGWTPPSVKDAALLFPNYEVLSLLGRGAMGAVYQARQTSLDRLVAIKLLPLEISVDRDFADRFRREARAMAKLSHPNIISVFDFGQTSEGHLYFAMEFVDGAMLHTLIHGRKGEDAPDLQPAEALALAGQVCDALAYAHEQGVVHRDIKPANVMIDRRGRVKVADFGLARIAEADPSQWGTTMTGVIMGTPDYMAPEQKRGMHVDHRADIYSLGVMLYEMLCKETPQGAFVLPSKRCGLDKRLDSIIIKALAQQPDARFQTTAEMKAAIEIIRPAVAKAQSKKPKPLPTGDGEMAPPSPHIAASPHSALANAETVLPHGANTNSQSSAKNRMPMYIGILAILVLIAGGISFLPKAVRTPAPSPAPLVPDPAKTSAVATKKAPFVNTLGMKFVPVPITGGPTSDQRVLFSIWETRVQDYEVFAKETSREWPKPTFPQTSMHPVVMVTRDDARAFCEWLTGRERKGGRILANELYRLPSDHEWSCAVGIGDREDPAQTPEDKDVKIKDVYPWGAVWPPPPGTGNYSGEEAAGHEVWNGQKIISGYRDDFPETAPVGSFRPNEFGIYDLSGNAYEWCEDRWNPGGTAGVLRGGSFNNGSQGYLLSCNRSRREQGNRSASDGFRVVLAADPAFRAKETAPAPAASAKRS